MKNLLESFVKSVLVEDLQGFLADTQGIRYDSWSADDQEIKAGGKDVKRAWAKNADHNFMKSLVKVHWLQQPSVKNFSWFLTSGGKDEVSTAAYRPGKPVISDWGSLGIVLDGRVTLASNSMDALFTGFAGEKSAEEIAKQAPSGTSKRAGLFKPAAASFYVLDSASFNENPRNEFILDNWHVVALVTKKPPNSLNKDEMSVVQAALSAGIPIWDTNCQDITSNFSV